MHRLAAAPPLERDTRESWEALVRALRRRGRVAALCALGFIAAVALLAFVWPKHYTAEAKVIVGTSGSPNGAAVTTTLPILNALLAQSGAQSTETYAELFKETPVAQAVIARLHLTIAPDVLATHVKVVPVTNTAILGVSATWPDAAGAAAIANAYADEFITRERALVAKQADGAVADIAQQIPRAHARVLQTEEALSRYESRNGIADIAAQTTGAIASATLLDTKLNAALVDRDQANAQIANLSAQLATTPRTTSNGGAIQPNPVAADLRQQIARTNVALRDARRQYTEEHPTVVGLVAQLASLQHELARTPPTVVAERDTAANPVHQQLSQQLANAQATVASDDAQIALLRQQRAAMTPTLRSLPGQTSRLADLQRDLKLANDVETALQQKYNEATVARTTAIADATIVQAADAATAVRTPNVPLVLAIGLVLGLALGVAVIVVREFFDATLKDAGDIERDLALPVIGKIPLMTGAGDALAVHDRYDVTEAFLQLVTALRYSSDKPLRALAVTSPSVGDGKSTIALNTAKALGELATINLDRLPAHVTHATEPRVLLVDADVRRPSVHKRLNLANTCGLSDVLVGNASIDVAIQRTPFPGLDVLTSGTASPNPIKLLTSERFEALLDELRSRYATVIFDAPAVTSVLDAAVVALKVDGTVMVLSAGTTDTRAARVAMARLESVGVTNLLGSILNRAHDMPEPYDEYVASVAAVRGKPVKALRA